MAKDQYGYESTPETRRRYGSGPLWTPMPEKQFSPPPSPELDVRNGWRGFSNQGGVCIRLEPGSSTRPTTGWGS
ncbi:hypothetical protein BH10CYA1_BH10CYA1_47040 [soil metagenome]